MSICCSIADGCYAPGVFRGMLAFTSAMAHRDGLAHSLHLNSITLAKAVTDVTSVSSNAAENRGAKQQCPTPHNKQGRAGKSAAALQRIVATD
jgi:hypothetical protein